MHKNDFYSQLLIVSVFIINCLMPAYGNAVQIPPEKFILTARDISAPFEEFMKCNAGELDRKLCTTDPAGDDFLFDNETITSLRKYQFVLIPGGEYDFFGELMGLCDGKPSVDFSAFIHRHPVLGKAIKNAILKRICPYYKIHDTDLYFKFFGTYEEYKHFFTTNKIPFRFLAYYRNRQPAYIGDRARKLDLLADTIDNLEAESDISNKDYVLIGHSYGGLNIADFLIELIGGHVQGTPEYRLFMGTKVRQWPAVKKEKIFNKIKGVAFLNTFLQGQVGPEIRLKNLAKENGIKSDDPMGYCIQYILKNYSTGRMPDTILWKQILDNTMNSARYRKNYYLLDRNTLAKNSGNPIQTALDKIAANIAIISIGCVIPRSFSEKPGGANFIEYRSRRMWQHENIPNDGMVDSYSTVFPRPSAEYAILYNKDHGTLVLKPQVSGITSGHSYSQIAFIKTLLKRLATKMIEMKKAQITK